MRHGQGDPSIYGNLLFISSEGTGNRTDCGTQGVQDKVSKDRMVGVRIFDISDLANPRKVADVQTCRGSHTHTLVPDMNDKSVVYVYVSGSAGVRSSDEVPGCVDGPIDSVGAARFRIEIIRVPLAHPEDAKVVSFARIFNGLTAPSAHGAAPGDVGAPPRTPRPNPAGAPPAPRGGPNQCHDITVYPEAGYAGGACGGYGLLLDIRDPLNPKRLQAVGDTNFAFWHSATFNNDGTKVLFTDEWGGGTQPKCRADDPIDWGGDAIFTISNGHMTQGAYFKMPAAQTEQENCVAHNGSLVPVPGRDIMAQGWYQGGLDVIDFTDASHPYELAYFDRGPVDSTKMVTAGYLGRVLVQRAHHRVGDRARARHLRAEAERVSVAERDRRGEAGALRTVQSADAAEVRVARSVSRRALLSRSARQGAGVGALAHGGDRNGAGCRGEDVWCRAQDGVDNASVAARRRRARRSGCFAGEGDGCGGKGPGERPVARMEGFGDR